MGRRPPGRLGPELLREEKPPMMLLHHSIYRGCSRAIAAEVSADFCNAQPKQRAGP
jgi:hypothetical protein